MVSMKLQSINLKEQNLVKDYLNIVKEMRNRWPWGVQCTKHVWVYVSAQEGVWFGLCRITYTYNKHI